MLALPRIPPASARSWHVFGTLRPPIVTWRHLKRQLPNSTVIVLLALTLLCGQSASFFSRMSESGPKNRPFRWCGSAYPEPASAERRTRRTGPLSASRKLMSEIRAGDRPYVRMEGNVGESRKSSEIGLLDGPLEDGEEDRHGIRN